MLQSLDTLIAFVVIMTIVSLIVTILVQMLSAAFSLRGKNLANALALTFQTIDPTLAASAHQLAAKILTDPLLSDSTVTDKDRGKHETPMQTGPWYAFWPCWGKAVKLANAIRPEEVYAALKKLAAGYDQKSAATIAAETALVTAQADFAKAVTPADKVAATGNIALATITLANCRTTDSQTFQVNIQNAQGSVKVAQDALVTAMGTPGATAAQTQLDAANKALDTLYAASLPGTAQKLLIGLGTPADTASIAADKLSAISALASFIPAANMSAFNVALSTTSVQLVALIDSEQKKFEDWFGSAQDRAQQWFQLHTRMVTICASILVAFVFQLDAVEIFHYVSTDSAARAALVAGADKVVKEGEGILEDKAALVEKINAAWTGTPRLTPENLKGVTNTTQLEGKLKDNASGGAWDQSAFEKTVRETSDAYYKQQKGEIGDLTKAVNANGFELIPIGYWRWPTPLPIKPGHSDCCPYFLTYWSHGLGMALFAALLTLGAPYWYNLLKNLTSLRPALAQLIGKEDAAETPAKK